MMKYFYFLFFFFAFGLTKANELKSLEINNTKLYHHLCAAEQSNQILILFLHGSVAAYQGQTESQSVAINVLLENNSVFVPTFNKEGFDVVLPIAYNEYNWLDSAGDQYLSALIDLYKNKYQHIYLAGFSDGGTGAYKFFNKHPEHFSGVLLFNAFPQHQNFYKQVDYQKISGKRMFFIAQDKDKVTPYEFPLVAYRRHKLINERTFFILEKGQHEFVKHSEILFMNIIHMLREENVNISKEEADSMTVYPPINGFMTNNVLVEMYSFRKSIGKAFGMRATEYAPQAKHLSRSKKHGLYMLLPLKIKRSDLTNENFTFKAIRNGKALEVTLPNYLVLPPW